MAWVIKAIVFYKTARIVVFGLMTIYVLVLAFIKPELIDEKTPIYDCYVGFLNLKNNFKRTKYG